MSAASKFFPPWWSSATQKKTLFYATLSTPKAKYILTMTKLVDLFANKNLARFVKVLKSYLRIGFIQKLLKQFKIETDGPCATRRTRIEKLYNRTHDFDIVGWVVRHRAAKPNWLI